MIFSLILGFVLGAAAIVFAFENNTIVALSFLGWQFESSLAIIVILALLVGALLTMLLTFPSALRDRFRIHGLHKENKKLVSALDEIQRQPTPIIIQNPPVV